jgi:hypothetical protein
MKRGGFTAAPVPLWKDPGVRLLAAAAVVFIVVSLLNGSTQGCAGGTETAADSY